MASHPHGHRPACTLLHVPSPPAALCPHQVRRYTLFASSGTAMDLSFELLDALDQVTAGGWGWVGEAEAGAGWVGG